MNYTCYRWRSAGAPGGQVGEVGDGDARDEDQTRSERLVIQSGLRETLSYRMP